MEKYDYLLAVRNDVKEYIEENINREDWQYPGARYDLQDKLYEDLWDEDSVTGNGSGSYTFNRWDAEENLCHNLDLLGEALEEFGCGHLGRVHSEALVHIELESVGDARVERLLLVGRPVFVGAVLVKLP